MDNRIFYLAVAFVLYSLPLIFRLIPPNRLYGWRAVRDRPDPSLWYRLNRYYGIRMLIGSCAVILWSLLRSSLSQLAPEYVLNAVSILLLVLTFILPVKMTIEHQKQLDR